MRKLSILFVVVAVFAVCPPPEAMAKIYVDISSPVFRQFPIALYDFSEDRTGKEISKIIQADLEFTGLIYFINKDAFLEAKTDDFNRKNWMPLGVDAVLKGDLKITDKLEVTIRFYDVVESSVILFKKYTTEKGMVESIAHTVSEDVYFALTGQKGIFRSKLSYIADRGNTKELMVMDYDGRRPQSLGFSRPLMLAPHWSKDRSKIVVSVMEDTQWSIYLIDLKNVKSSRIFSAEGVNITGDFSVKGDTFVFSSSQGGSPNIYLFDLKTGRAQGVNKSIWIEISPALSPDGKEVAFVSNRSGSPQVYIMDINGYNIRRITFSGTYNTSPSWSPAGDLIVFSGLVNGANQVFTVKPDGTDQRQLTNSGNNEDPVFSPDGRYIAFTSDRSGKKAIHTMRADGENQKKISPEGSRAFGPDWY
ncbi:MAG: DPP IV N-terminal domain-containing protein [bacterium]